MLKKRGVHAMLSNPSREIEYRLAKWTIANLEAKGLMTPQEIETIWGRILSEYKPPTASVEVPCASMLAPIQGGHNEKSYKD